MIKARSLWPECAEPGTHDLCLGVSATAECTCWHHITKARTIANAVRLVDELEEQVKVIEFKLRAQRIERGRRRWS